MLIQAGEQSFRPRAELQPRCSSSRLGAEFQAGTKLRCGSIFQAGNRASDGGAEYQAGVFWTKDLLPAHTQSTVKTVPFTVL